MELDCRVCGKAYGRGADKPSKCVQVFSSPIIHDLFIDSSWCNEQSYLGEKGLPSPGIEPKTFSFLCRCSNHWATRLGWLNKEKLLHTTMLGLSCCFNTPRTLTKAWQLYLNSIVRSETKTRDKEDLKLLRHFFLFRISILSNLSSIIDRSRSGITERKNQFSLFF